MADQGIDPVHGAEMAYNPYTRNRPEYVRDWREPMHGEHYRTCDYCGSIHPDDLAAEPTWVAEWADRKYGWPHKFYINIVNRTPERLFVLGSSSRPVAPAAPYTNWKHVADLNEEELAVLDREYPADSVYRPKGSVLLGTRRAHHAKFYTVHYKDLAISDETKETIQRISGLKFTWLDDGRVQWGPWREH